MCPAPVAHRAAVADLHQRVEVEDRVELASTGLDCPAATRRTGYAARCCAGAACAAAVVLRRC